jgi:hypothetical protein
MATDGSGNVVLFGGSSGSGYLADTWIWDGSSWKQAAPAVSPSARTNAAMAADANGNIVLFGGNGSMVGALSDTWVFSVASDTTPPVITVPTNVTVPATNPTGATVIFQATATDDVDGQLPVTCQPTSGTVFPIGATTVSCFATDDAGNTATATFTITVRGAAEQLASLWGEVRGVGPGTSLADKVSAAQAALAADQPQLASEIIAALVNQVEAQSGKTIDVPEPAATLIRDATRIAGVLGS